MRASAVADVVVVGAGIVGAATAYYLGRRGVRVVLVDKGAVGDEQSGRAWGFVRRQGRPPAAMALMATASRMWTELEAELEADIGFVRGGSLAVAETAADVQRLEEGHRAAREAGVSARLLTAAEVRALLPAMRGRWATGLYSEEDGQAEPRAVTAAFARAAGKQGVRIWEQCTVLAIETHGDAVSGVETDRGRIETPQVVVAAGVWTASLVAPLGVEVPQRVVRSTVAETHPAPPLTRLAIWTPQVTFRQRATGHVVLGYGYRGPAAVHDLTLASLRHLRLFLPAYRDNRRLLRLRLGRPLLADLAARWRGDRRSWFTHGPWAVARPSSRVLRHAERAFHALFPDLGHLGLARAWAGYIELTPDLLPILGPVARPRGLYLAVAASHGFSMGPVIGQRLAEVIVGADSGHDLRPFRPSRFREGPMPRMRKVL